MDVRQRQAWIDGLLSAQQLIGILMLDARGHIVQANPTVCGWLGISESEVLRINVRDLMGVGARLLYDTQLEPMMRLHREWREVALDLLNPSSRESVPVLASAVACDEGGDGLHGVLMVLFRASERRRYEQELLRARKSAENTALALFNEKERARVTLDSVGEGVLVIDAEGRLTYMNPAAEQLTQMSRSSAEGLPVESVLPLLHEIDPRDPHRVHALRAALSQSGPAVRLSGFLPIPPSEPRAVEGTVAAIPSREGRPGGAVAVLRDVTDAINLRRRLTYQATHDLLTGVPNRAEFEAALEQALCEVRAGGGASVLLFLDLDGFKIVNDTCGHMAGDELLRQIGQLLAARTRSTDMLARIGGDEFGILLRQCSLEDGARAAEGLVAAVGSFRFGWQSQFFKLGVSIGVAALDDHCADAAEALSAADSACGWAKHRGRNQMQVFRRDDQHQRQLHEQKGWLGKLNRALTQETLELHAQRIVRLDGDVTAAEHFEILLRLREDDGSLVSPGLFLPVAERYRMMVRIDAWVIGKLFDQIAPSVTELIDAREFSVNLSGASINDPAFLQFLLDAFGRYGIPGSLICFEITETVAIANISQAIDFIHKLSAIGCRFALDDFGSGLSSFDYLRQLPVSIVKIDGSFVTGVASDPICRAMIEAICRVGKIMHLQTVAERVESEADLSVLREIGIDYVQGYAVHRPEPLSALERVAGSAMS